MQEFRRHCEIYLCTRQVCVPHIDRELRQQLLNVFAFAVPRRQPVDGRGMPKVVEARLATWSTVPVETRLGADLLERVFKRADVYSLPIPRQKNVVSVVFNPAQESRRSAYFLRT
jgi:hypothetical protein